MSSDLGVPTNPDEDWLEDDAPTEPDAQIDEYDLASSPNDFNVSTIVDFIDSGAVNIPGFQRNYVWDIKRASKLIESLIIGLPVPQVFLYEEARNKFLVIDGQQRLMSIYYFVKGRFPRKERRVELRRIIDQAGTVPDHVLADDDFFDNFNLQLPRISAQTPNRFHRLNYDTLGEYQTSLKLRTIRNVIVKQVKPSDDDSSIYEMFNRLNTGGVLLTPQEIRASLYHSSFYEALHRLNLSSVWRTLLDRVEPELHMRDTEVLLRAIALWQRTETYSPSMVRFLNDFSKQMRQVPAAEVAVIEDQVTKFLQAVEDVPRTPFLTKQGRFSVTLFESVFVASMQNLSVDPSWTLSEEAVADLATDPDFLQHSQEQTTDTVNVRGRIKAARKVLGQ